VLAVGCRLGLDRLGAGQCSGALLLRRRWGALADPSNPIGFEQSR
jgi:hypothetical protein